jgi:DNA-binding NarL/FixJ family response regulator
MLVSEMRILIADDQPSVRSALKLLLGQRAEMNVAGEATTSRELLTWLRSNSADLVLIDWELPGQPENGILPVVRRMYPDVALIAMDSHPQSRQEAMAQGADDFIVKGEPPEHLLDAVENGWEIGRRPGQADFLP